MEKTVIYSLVVRNFLNLKSPVPEHSQSAETCWFEVSDLSCELNKWESIKYGEFTSAEFAVGTSHVYNDPLTNIQPLPEYATQSMMHMRHRGRKKKIAGFAKSKDDASRASVRRRASTTLQKLVSSVFMRYHIFRASYLKRILFKELNEILSI